MTIEEAKNALTQLANFDFNDFTNEKYRNYKQQFFSVFNELKEFPIAPVPLNSQEFTRCRINEGKLFTNLKQVWCPPSKKIKIGRLNFNHDRLFYCAHDPATALFEVHPKKGDIVTCLTFKLKQPSVICLNLGSKHLAKKESKFKSEISRLLYDFIIKECRKIVPKDRIELYCPIMLFAKSISRAPFDSFTYDSVAANYKGVNFAFNPNYVKKHFAFVEARTIRILETIEDSSYKIQCIYNARKIDRTIFNWEQVLYCYGHEVTVDGLGNHSR